MLKFITHLAIGTVFSLTVTTPVMANPASQVPAQDFLGAELMQSPLHRVAPMAQNNGYVNIYTIETADGAYVAHGTEQARIMIREIHATHQLRQQSTVGMMGKSFVNATANLVKTPVRIVEGVGDRIDSVQSFEDAVFLAPKTVGEVGGTLINGAGELAHTGVRIVSGVAGTRCSGIGECVSDAGRDVLSGVNSIAGKHSSARNIHARLGTDNETLNPMLQKEVNRLAYANAYTGVAFNLTVPNAGLNHLSSYHQGVRWVNNSEFVAQYQDAYRGPDREKASLTALGIDQDTIDRLYANESFTNSNRTALAAALSAMGPTPYSDPFARDAAAADSPHIVRNKIEVYQYFAQMAQNGHIRNFVSGPGTLAYRPDGTYVMPLKADYLQWTAQSQQAAEFLAQTARNGQNRAEMHVLGQASPEFKSQATRMGIKVINIG